MSRAASPPGRRPGIQVILRAAPWTLAALTVVALVAGLAPAGAAVALRLFVDGVLGRATGAELVGASALFVGSGLVAAVATEAIGYLCSQLSRSAGVEITSRLYEQVATEPGIERLEQPTYQDQVQLAAMASDFAPQQLVTAGLGVAQASVTVISLFWVMAASQPVVAAVAVLGSLPVLVVENWLARRRVLLRTQLVPVERRRQAYRSLIVDPVAGKEIRLFELGAFFRTRMVRDLRTANRAERRVDRISLVAGLGLAGAHVLLTIAVVALALRGSASGAVSAGELTAVIASFVALSGVLGAAVAGFTQAREATSMLRAYDDVVAATRVRPAGRAPVGRLEREVRLENVWFRYADDLPWVLRGVDLTIRAGGSTALVGLNGAGKSTVVKLVCGLYQPTAGRVLWDSLDLAEADPVSLRARLGTVFQDFMMYDLTAHENIALGDLRRLDDPGAVRAAAEAADIAGDLDALPRGYDTMLSRLMYRDPGAPDDPDPRMVLSGGQWQRLALARMLVRGDRDMLILDEPSAGLDPLAEHRVHRSVQETMRGRARLLISHRLSAVRMADHIAVLHRGRIVERGDHASLLRARGRYADLFRLQASGYADGPSVGATELVGAGPGMDERSTA